MADVTVSALTEYLDGLVMERNAQLRAMEARAKETGFPIVGPASANMIYMLARALGVRRAFELGSGYGYSTAWIARAIDENGGGQVYHVVWHDDLSADARKYLGEMGYPAADEKPDAKTTVRYVVGEAHEALQNTDGPFDLMFMDIDKTGYPKALPEIERKLRPGGLLVVDNVIWQGKVVDSDGAPETEAILELNERVSSSPLWMASIAPMRDGLLLAVKR